MDSKILRILKKPIKLRFLFPIIYVVLVIFSWLILMGMKQEANNYLIISVPAFLLLLSDVIVTRYIPFIGAWIVNGVFENKGFVSFLTFIISKLILILILFMVGYLLDKLYEIKNSKKS
jgi:hypothetical protein